ncbi:MAG: hypothetical protein VKI81_00300 [Synechococcaceae cyanobacterium]|nr:hypothetical protein [Synechococcaceae cyanobacterium]
MRSTPRQRPGRRCATPTPAQGNRDSRNERADRRRAVRERREARLRTLQAVPSVAGDPLAVMEGGVAARTHTAERQELFYSLIGLGIKLGLIGVFGVSLVRLAGAYQQRMERQGEISAVLELEQAKLDRARRRFDQLFMAEGEQRLIREQSQWIAPDRLRVVFQPDGPAPGKEAPVSALPTVDSGAARPEPRRSAP